VFGAFSVAAGVFVGVAEYVDVPFDEHIPVVILFVGVTVIAYGFLKDIIVRYYGDWR
jgi:ACR3 family arsenite efflux pump ArsB